MEEPKYVLVEQEAVIKHPTNVETQSKEKNDEQTK